jgi:hypothetical protein
MMFSSQSSAQSVGNLSGGTETGIKRIVASKGLRHGVDLPGSEAETEPRLLKKNQLKENIASYLRPLRLDQRRLAG